MSFLKKEKLKKEKIENFKKSDKKLKILKKNLKKISFVKNLKKSEKKIEHQRRINNLFRKRFLNPYDEFSTDSEKEFTFRKNSYEYLKQNTLK